MPKIIIGYLFVKDILKSWQINFTFMIKDAVMPGLSVVHLFPLKVDQGVVYISYKQLNAFKKQLI